MEKKKLRYVRRFQFQILWFKERESYGIIFNLKGFLINNFESSNMSSILLKIVFLSFKIYSVFHQYRHTKFTNGG
jgi:hypothetical protein